MTLFALEDLSDRSGVKLRGELTVGEVGDIERRLAELAPLVGPEFRWDLREITHIDTAAALALWDAWSGTLPRRLELPERHRDLFVRLSEMDAAALDQTHRRPHSRHGRFPPLANLIGVLTVFGRFVLDALLLIRHPRQFPLKELSAACFRASVTALPIVICRGRLQPGGNQDRGGSFGAAGPKHVCPAGAARHHR